MRLVTFSRGFSALVVSGGIFVGPVLAAPQMPSGAPVPTSSVAVEPQSVVASLGLAPLATIPVKIGSIAITAKNDCGIALLGSSLSEADTEKVAFGSAREKRSLMRRLKDSFSVTLCGLQSSGAKVAVANDEGTKKIFTGSRRGIRVDGTSLLSADLNSPNAFATVHFSKRVAVGGARFIAQQYELLVGTDAQSKIYLIIIGRADNKIVLFHQDHGVYHGDLSDDVIRYVLNSLGVAKERAPQLMLYNK
jgi:hypothetical protein